MRPGRLPRWIRILIVLLLLAAPFAGGAVILMMLNEPAVATMNSVELPFSPQSEIIPLASTVLVSENAFLYCYTKDGVRSWEYQLELQDARFSATEETVAIWSGSALRLLDADGNSIFARTMVQDIAEVRCGNKMFAMLSVDGIISVFDESGAALDTIEQPGVEVLDFAFYNQGNYLWVLSLDVTGTSPTSHISTYLPNRLLTSGNKYSDQIIYRALFHQNDIAFVGSRTLYLNAEAGAQGKTTEVLVYGWEMVDNSVNKDRIAMLFAPSTQIADGKLDRIKYICGSDIQEIKTASDCFAAKLGQKGMYMFSRDRVNFRSFSGETRTLTSSVPIEDVVALFNDDSMMVRYDNALYVLTY